ncbi:uncharacterized protein B0H18DRAFT_1080141 [Fomitopsis serialis]|uniref:uncharacterized protein n=1 Tax=Fomitopsis serialis TaxID=139415 RepID=UPI0020088C81|nr:uncharacterized protein B0H18DRAFT_1080141 [Neoantrodia serialis]KAH9905546.1 hypothetical protein B0H18DRAFT_1080141 [Neoantrodia serialis]
MHDHTSASPQGHSHGKTDPCSQSTPHAACAHPLASGLQTQPPTCNSAADVIPSSTRPAPSL